MKIKTTTTHTYDFDVEKEKKRLKTCFKGSQLKRQMEILDAFLAEDLKMLESLYNALPRCKRRGCPEQEFVGRWICLYTGSDWGSPPIREEHTIEFIKE